LEKHSTNVCVNYLEANLSLENGLLDVMFAAYLTNQTSLLSEFWNEMLLKNYTYNNLIEDFQNENNNELFEQDQWKFPSFQVTKTMTNILKIRIPMVSQFLLS
jgi:hypothetical protein